MRERTIATARGIYKMADWDGVNRSGGRPVCDTVLVLVDEAVTKTAGGIFTTDATQEQVSLSSCTGVIVAIGPQAFAYDSDRLVKWEGERPAVGQRVWFQRYAGQEHYGLDGRLYRIMQDRTIGMVEDEEAMRAAEELAARPAEPVFLGEGAMSNV
jgi:chaperonin GroES